MMRVAVIDDEALARRAVTRRLAGQPDLQLVGEFADGLAALDALRGGGIDLVIIDVQMPGLDGISVLEALPANQRPLSILLTAHEQFAVRAFALRAADYLLKPVDDERFADALDRARQLWTLRESLVFAQERQPASEHERTPQAEPAPENENRAEPSVPARPATLDVRVGRRHVLIRVEEISHIEADGDYATLHAGGKAWLYRQSLQRLSEQLDPERFLRIHRSAIVRLDAVAEMQLLANRDAMLRLHDGTPLRVSRTYIDRLRAGLRLAPIGG